MADLPEIRTDQPESPERTGEVRAWLATGELEPDRFEIDCGWPDE